MNVPLRLLVVEDHPIFLDGLLAALSGAERVGQVHAATSVTEGLDVLAREQIDVALVDLALPDGSGSLLVAAATAAGAHALVLTMSDDPGHFVEAVRAGARGYLVKGSGRHEILSAVVAVAEGDVLFGADVAELALGAVTRQDPRSAAFPQLSNRELDVLDLLGLGLSNHAIAERLTLSEKTVRNRVSDILTKLGVASRHDAAELLRGRRGPRG